MSIEKIIDDLINILDIYNGSKELISNQGQPLDGYSALANFIRIAEKSKEYRKGINNDNSKP